MFKHTRRGKVQVSFEMLEEQEITKLLFSEFTPIISHIDFRHVEYSGFSDHFREIDNSERPPLYSAVLVACETKEGRRYSIKFEECKPL